MTHYSAKKIWADAIAMRPLPRIPFWPKLWNILDKKVICEWLKEYPARM